MPVQPAWIQRAISGHRKQPPFHMLGVGRIQSCSGDRFLSVAFSFLLLRPFRHSHIADERILDNVARVFQITDKPLRVADEWSFVALEQRNEGGRGGRRHEVLPRKRAARGGS